EPAVVTAHFRGAPLEARPGGCHQSAVLGVDTVKAWGRGRRSLAGHPQQPPGFSIKQAERAVWVPECYRTGQMVENRTKGWQATLRQRASFLSRLMIFQHDHLQGHLSKTHCAPGHFSSSPIGTLYVSRQYRAFHRFRRLIGLLTAV